MLVALRHLSCFDEVLNRGLICSLLMHFVALGILTGEEEVRPAGLSSMDSSRRRISSQILNSGTFSKQKSPVAQESAFSKEALVRTCLLNKLIYVVVIIVVKFSSAFHICLSIVEILNSEK